MAGDDGRNPVDVDVLGWQSQFIADLPENTVPNLLDKPCAATAAHRKETPHGLDVFGNVTPLRAGIRERRPEGNSIGGTDRAKTDPVAKRVFGREEDFAVANAVCDVADAKGLPPAQVALAWVLKNSTITAPIIGASKPGHIADAIAAMDVELSDDDCKTIEDPYRPQWPKGHQ